MRKAISYNFHINIRLASSYTGDKNMTLWQEVFLYIIQIKQTEMVESERINVCGGDKIRRKKKFK